MIVVLINLHNLNLTAASPLVRISKLSELVTMNLKELSIGVGAGTALLFAADKVVSTNEVYSQAIKPQQPLGRELKLEDKVTICHRTDAVNNPYVEITVDSNAVDGVAGNSGNQADHFGQHKGPIATNEAVARDLKEDHVEWGDIIPPVPPHHGGQNWSSVGQAILENDCNFVQPTETPRPSGTPRPTETQRPKPTNTNESERTRVPNVRTSVPQRPARVITPSIPLPKTPEVPIRIDLPRSGNGPGSDSRTGLLASVMASAAGLGLIAVGSRIRARK